MIVVTRAILKPPLVFFSFEFRCEFGKKRVLSQICMMFIKLLVFTDRFLNNVLCLTWAFVWM